MLQLSISFSPLPSIDPIWKDAAISALKEFLRNQDSGYEFRVEQFREWCEEKNRVPEPTSKRAFGAVIKTAQRLSMVRFIGTSKVTNPNANGCFCGVWVKI